MSEDNQENGASNGDVPEIELIIKDEMTSTKNSVSEVVLMSTVQLDQLVLPITLTNPTNDEYIIYELKSDTDGTPSVNYVITNPNEPPPDPDDQPNNKENTNNENIVSSVTQVLSKPGPYIVSVEIPIEDNETELTIAETLVSDSEILETETESTIAETLESETESTIVETLESETESTIVETLESETEPANVVQKTVSPKTKRALKRTKLAEAVDAVINNDLTISKAAKAFGVTKSTLWRAVNKQTDQRKKKVDEDLNKKICDRICAGESLSEISRSLKVAKSTIHLHKVRLWENGKLPRHITFKKPVDKANQLAIKDRIIQAFRGVRVNGMSLRLAAEFFSVPRSTLWCYIKKWRASQKKQEEMAATTCQGDEEEETSDEENEITSDQRSSISESVLEEDFDLLDAYCEQRGNSENGDLLISIDFETFEEYVKREFEES